MHNAFEDNVGMQMGIGIMKKIIQYGNESNRFNVKSICMQQFSNGKGSKGYYWKCQTIKTKTGISFMKRFQSPLQ